jgi:L-fuconate dehydratase
MGGLKIEKVEVTDIRFPTSLDAHGSDAMHTDPDYSCAYVVLHVAKDPNLKGYGLTFTCGRGTEIGTNPVILVKIDRFANKLEYLFIRYVLVVQAIKTMSYLVEGQDCKDIWNNFAAFYRSLTSESQIRWVNFSNP